MSADLVKAFGRRVFSPLLGKVRYEPLFRALYELSLVGMNFGEGTNPSTSGEVAALHYVRDRLPLRQDRVLIFDVGANIGRYLSILLRIFGSQACIWSFEPSARTFPLLQQHIGSRENVKLVNVGFGDQEQILPLYSSCEGSTVASLYHRRLYHEGLATTSQENVQIKTIDKFFADEGISRIDFLKLDVERHELKALLGAQAMLERGSIRYLQFEFGAPCIYSRTYFRDFYLLLHERYRLYRIMRDGLLPIESYRETYEIYKRATNYLAEYR